MFGGVPGSPRCSSCTAAPKTAAYPKTGALSRGGKVRQGHSGGLQPASQVAGHHLDLQATKDRFSQAIHTLPRHARPLLTLSEARSRIYAFMHAGACAIPGSQSCV